MLTSFHNCFAPRSCGRRYLQVVGHGPPGDKASDMACGPCGLAIRVCDLTSTHHHQGLFLCCKLFFNKNTVFLVK